MKADEVTIREPCAEDWSAMDGEGPQRFCDACSRHVHNLSEMTKPEATALLEGREGRLCVRYTVNTDGSVRFREPATRPSPPPVTLVQLRSRPRTKPRPAAALARAGMAAGMAAALAACTPLSHEAPEKCDETIMQSPAESEPDYDVLGKMEKVEPRIEPLEYTPPSPPQIVEPSPPPTMPHVRQGALPRPLDLEPPQPIVEALPVKMGDIARLPPTPPPVEEEELMGDIAELPPTPPPIEREVEERMGKIAYDPGDHDPLKGLDEDVPCDTSPTSTAQTPTRF